MEPDVFPSSCGAISVGPFFIKFPHSINRSLCDQMRQKNKNQQKLRYVFFWTAMIYEIYILCVQMCVQIWPKCATLWIKTVWALMWLRPDTCPVHAQSSPSCCWCWWRYYMLVESIGMKTQGRRTYDTTVQGIVGGPHEAHRNSDLHCVLAIEH